jgi:hypothetical protein
MAEQKRRRTSVKRAGVLGAGPGLETERREGGKEGRKESPELPGD